MYAVVEVGGRQVRVEPGQDAIIDHHPGLEPGAEFFLDKVLLVGGENPRVGAPYVQEARVRTTVQGHLRGKQVTVFRFRRRKRIRVKRGFRAWLTRVRVEELQGI